MALGQVFSKHFGFLCQFEFHWLLHNHHHLTSGAGTIGQTVAAVPSGLSLSPWEKKTRKVTLKLTNITQANFSLWRKQHQHELPSSVATHFALYLALPRFEITLFRYVTDLVIILSSSYSGMWVSIRRACGWWRALIHSSPSQSSRIGESVADLWAGIQTMYFLIVTPTCTWSVKLLSACVRTRWI
jgi:hypothetical protein